MPAKSRLEQYGGTPELDNLDFPWQAICQFEPTFSGSFKSREEAVGYAASLIDTHDWQNRERAVVVSKLSIIFNKRVLKRPSVLDEDLCDEHGNNWPEGLTEVEFFVPSTVTE